jgi:hypothetical protein
MQPKRHREDSADTSLREELLRVAKQIRLEVLEDQRIEIELDQALLEAAKELDEQEKAEKERRQRLHAKELLRTMSTAEDLPGQWRNAIAYVHQCMHTG